MGGEEQCTRNVLHGTVEASHHMRGNRVLYGKRLPRVHVHCIFYRRETTLPGVSCSIIV